MGASSRDERPWRRGSRSGKDNLLRVTGVLGRETQAAMMRAAGYDYVGGEFWFRIDDRGRDCSTA